MRHFSNDPLIKRSQSHDDPSNVAFGKTIQSLNDIAKTSHKFLSMTIQTSHTRPFTSNDGTSYQNNGKIATSKGEGKAHLRPFEQVVSLLVTRLLATTKNTFIHQHSYFKTFPKDKTFCIRSYRDENHCKISFRKPLSKSQYTSTPLNYLSKQNFVYVLIETRTIAKYLSENHFPNHNPQVHL